MAVRGRYQCTNLGRTAAQQIGFAGDAPGFHALTALAVVLAQHAQHAPLLVAQALLAQALGQHFQFLRLAIVQATQMGTQNHEHPGYLRLVELLRSGAIGQVRDVVARLGETVSLIAPTQTLGELFVVLKRSGASAARASARFAASSAWASCSR